MERALCALQVMELTGPDGIELVDVPDPDPGDGVLIDVEAAGDSFPGLLLSRGVHQSPSAHPSRLFVARASRNWLPGVSSSRLSFVRNIPTGARFHGEALTCGKDCHPEGP
jgi:hypothetical protein